SHRASPCCTGRIVGAGPRCSIPRTAGGHPSRPPRRTPHCLTAPRRRATKKGGIRPVARVENRLPRHQTQDGRPSPNQSVDPPRIEAAVREILLAVGEDPDREGLRETPARVARMYAELFSGLHCDPREFLSKSFTQKY